MNKILVPIDFSENARKALRTAAQIAGKSKASLEMLHVNIMLAYEPSFPEYPTSTEIAAHDYEDEVADRMREWQEDLLKEEQFKDLSVTSKVAEGHLHPIIEHVADGDACDLIVMGTKGTSNALQAVIGSNTEKVIRHAHCPVLAVPAQAREGEIRTVVFASTLAEDQVPAFIQLARLQASLGFDVQVLCMHGFGESADLAWMQARLRELSQFSGLKNAVLHTATVSYDQEKKILEFAHSMNADMVVMATHQRKGLAHILIGSLTEHTANRSDIPVLCIPVS
jgi:nucleotide-binding universal stress UspA family protein